MLQVECFQVLDGTERLVFVQSKRGFGAVVNLCHLTSSPPSTAIASDRDGPIEAALPERANCSLRNARVQSSSCHSVTEAIVSPMCVASADAAVLKLLLQQNI